MKTPITRREFLKIATTLPLYLAAPRFLDQLNPQERPQNVIVIVFDAFSACNIPFYGYSRDTTPNLTRLAERAVVYHNHYSGANFTSPGTAALLTGSLPWTNRAFRNNGTVTDYFIKRNLFSVFDGYHRITYSHNPWVYTLLGQFKDEIENLIPLERFLLQGENIVSKAFGNDLDIATLSWIRTMLLGKEGYAYSLYLSHLYKKQLDTKINRLVSLYPRGVPTIDYINYFLLEHVVDWLGNYLPVTPQPFMGYFHFWPPHEPYRTRWDYYRRFEGDGYLPVQKPNSPFAYGPAQKDPSRLMNLRETYDEYILYADREFSRLYNLLEQAGVLENTWLVLTSDHGEMFERGIEGHTTPVLYQPLIHIPFLIFEPGRTTRKDIFTPTSSIDVLPTLSYVTGQEPATWSEGNILPPYHPEKRDSDRTLFALEARKNEVSAPFTVATFAMVKGKYKLLYFLGYQQLEGSEKFELYDLESDPEELYDLSLSKPETAAELLNELKAKIAEVNEPYL